MHKMSIFALFLQMEIWKSAKKLLKSNVWLLVNSRNNSVYINKLHMFNVSLSDFVHFMTFFGIFL